MCVGLDPDPDADASLLDTSAEPAWEFCRAIVDATADLVCAFSRADRAPSRRSAPSPSSNGCAPTSAEEYPDAALILDAKRGDIGSTAEHYAAAGVQQVSARMPSPSTRTSAATRWCRTSRSGVR